MGFNYTFRADDIEGWDADTRDLVENRDRELELFFSAYEPTDNTSMVVSDTPPTTPAPQVGDQWFESDTGRALVYYDNAWVEVGSTATTNVNANDLSGTVLASNVVSSSLTSVGTLGSLSVSGSILNGSDYLSPYNGFRNAIINGDFRINQRGWSSSTATGTYGFDRWAQVNSGGTVTMSSQLFTVGSPAATGYEAEKFCRLVSASQSSSTDYAILTQRIEDVRTLANATATVSFWAKASSGTPKVAVEMYQYFGTGGSPSADVTTYAGQVTLSTSWTRYSVTVSVPSISGKTIGTTANTSYLALNLWTSAGTSLNSRTGSLGIQNNTFDFWGVQVERGSYATPFEQRPIQTELALCQRYYEKSYAIGTAPGTNGFTGAYMTMGTTDSGNNAQQIVTFRTPKRYTAYTITTYNGFGASGYSEYYRNGGSSSVAVPTLDAYTENSFRGYVATGAAYAAVQFYFHWVCNAEF